MIKIENKRNCTGCGACVTVCPKNVICMTEDQEGFIYPEINEDKCVQCGLCDSVCHMNKNFHAYLGSYKKFYAACLKDKKLLKDVSSGGAAWALTQYFIKNNGIVYGAIHNSLGNVHHKRAETLSEAENFRKSKYLQSNIGNCYAETLEDLNTGKQVLFTGTPCQIAGLYGYLGREFKNLYTVDIVCHGVPSATAFRSYITGLEKKHHCKVKDIVFRDKSYGWNQNHYAIYYENGLVTYEYSNFNLFHSAYLQGLLGRPSCGNCRYASLPRIADITVADFWKYNGTFKANNDNQGISLVVCNTPKAYELTNNLSDYLFMEEVSYELATLSCRHLTKTPKESHNRSTFFKLLNKTNYFTAARICLPKRMLVYSKIKKIRRTLNAKRKN